ncbi:hypothetical protein GOC74_05180 [Halomicrobium mukohataei]|uniref:Uncharacterized protein n=1 Tax=Halomicrobium mukohataei TaxID=57705 RepID=A0A847U123_9EURY|nr:hypothetical protein [Halomicrobium mukohataei]NLV09323.1 hypothetical protein [Halomicrobium mukohataei]
MVRGPESQFAHKIEKIRAEEGFSGGSVIKKMQDDGTGEEYGEYAYLVSPPSHGREWFYLGKYSKEIDLDERAEMDFNRLIYRYKELDKWWLARQLEDINSIDDYAQHVYAISLGPMRKAKNGDITYQQAWKDTLFSRGSFDAVQTQQQMKLTLKLLDHLEREIEEIHLDGGRLEPALKLVVEKRKEWGKIPSSYDRFQEGIESGEEPKFIN